MTKPVRKRLSAMAWAATAVCSLLLLVSALAAAAHKSDITAQETVSAH